MGDGTTPYWEEDRLDDLVLDAAFKIQRENRMWYNKVPTIVLSFLFLLSGSLQTTCSVFTCFL